MATLRFPNRAGQEGVFYTGSPDYVDVDNASDPLAEMLTFASQATTWATSDLVGVLIKKDATNYKIWVGEWDATNEYVEKFFEEEAVGTISDSDAVEVTAVLTQRMAESLVFEPQIKTISGTTHTTADEDCGKLHRCTSSSAVAITLDSSSKVPWQGLFVQEGAGTVTISRASTDTINNGTDPVAIPARYKTAYVYQYTEGAWMVLT